MNSRRVLAVLVVSLSLAAIALPVAAQDGIFSWFYVSEKTETPPPPPCPLCDILQQQLQKGCRIGNDSPYADTAYLRLAVVPPLTDAMRRDIGLARMGSDAGFAADLLGPVLDDRNPEARYAAALTVATLQVQRDGGFDDLGQRALDTMENAIADGMHAVPPSDYHFLRALEARDRGDTLATRREITETLRLEPRFFGAMILSLDIAVDRALTLQGQGESLCKIAYDELLYDSARILDLAPCRYHAAHLELYLQRQFSNPETVAPLSAVQVYLALISGRKDAAMIARDRFAGADIADCRVGVLLELDDLVDSQEGTGN